MRYFLLSLVLLTGCADWNENSGSFATLAEFQATRYGGGGFLPATLLPPSARDIHFRYNMDSTEVEATFAFDGVDAERVIAPFRSPDQVRLHELERDGSIPPSKVRSPLLIRCADNRVEFLQITDMNSARYWTSVDREIRRTACTTVASTSPLI